MQAARTNARRPARTLRVAVSSDFFGRISGSREEGGSADGR